jgi:hypothetical protein
MTRPAGADHVPFPLDDTISAILVSKTDENHATLVLFLHIAARLTN